VAHGGLSLLLVPLGLAPSPKQFVSMTIPSTQLTELTQFGCSETYGNLVANRLTGSKLVTKY